MRSPLTSGRLPDIQPEKVKAAHSSPAGSLAAKQRLLIFSLLAIGLVLIMLISISSSASDVRHGVPLQDVFRVIAHHVPWADRYIQNVDPLQNAMVWEQRVPRVLTGALIGILLAMAGVAFQSLLRNPLADPYMVGVSAGSALGSVLVIVFGGTALLVGFAQPLAAFAAGLLTMVVVYSLSKRGGRLSSDSFLLAGIVIGSFLWSLIQLTLALAIRSRDPGTAASILSQLLGSIPLVGWKGIALLLPFGLVGGTILMSGWRELNLMALGEESAANLGVETEAFKRRVIIAGSLVTAATVSVAGIIAFVGMLVPQIARRIVGPDHRVLLPASMLLGGIVLVLSDWLSRVFLNQLEIGVITSLLGAPVFCLLLRRRVSGR